MSVVGGWRLAVLRTNEPTCWMYAKNWAEFSDMSRGRRTLVEGWGWGMGIERLGESGGIDVK